MGEGETVFSCVLCSLVSLNVNLMAKGRELRQSERRLVAASHRRALGESYSVRLFLSGENNLYSIRVREQICSGAFKAYYVRHAPKTSAKLSH